MLTSGPPLPWVAVWVWVEVLARMTLWTGLHGEILRMFGVEVVPDRLPTQLVPFSQRATVPNVVALLRLQFWRLRAAQSYLVMPGQTFAAAVAAAAIVVVAVAAVIVVVAAAAIVVAAAAVVAGGGVVVQPPFAPVVLAAAVLAVVAVVVAMENSEEAFAVIAEEP